MALKPGDLGVHLYSKDPVKVPCKDCPFTHPKQLYLSDERMENIKFSVTLGQPFFCHKTVHRPGIEEEEDLETGATHPPKWLPSYQSCKGAQEWALNLAKELGVTPTINGRPTEDPAAHAGTQPQTRRSAQGQTVVPPAHQQTAERPPEEPETDA